MIQLFILEKTEAPSKASVCLDLALREEYIFDHIKLEPDSRQPQICFSIHDRL